MTHDKPTLALSCLLLLALASCGSSGGGSPAADAGGNDTSSVDATTSDDATSDGGQREDATSRADAATSTGGPTELASLDEPCGDNGLTGQHLLDRTRPTYTTTLDLKAYTTGLAISLAFGKGKVLCHPRVEPPPGSAAPEIPEKVTVEVTLDFVTDDGTFTEGFVTPLSAMLAGDVTFSHAMPVGDLVGTFDPGLVGYNDVTVSFSGRFNGETTQGHVGKGGTRPGKAPESFPFVAQWPAKPEACTPRPASCAPASSFRCEPVTQGMAPPPEPPKVCGCFADSCPQDQFLVVNAMEGTWCDGSSKGTAHCSSTLPP